jgi:hypothetical protein
MDMVTAIAPYAAYAGLIATVVVLLNRIFSADGSAVDTLFRIELDPPRPRGVQEDEPVRWNVERMRRPTRPDASLPGVSVPAGVRGLPSAG